MFDKDSSKFSTSLEIKFDKLSHPEGKTRNHFLDKNHKMNMNIRLKLKNQNNV